jgi:ankyrin repeat protein
MPPDAKAQRVIEYARQDCGNLIRCALAAGGSAGARDEEGTPAIYWAARCGKARGLKALLDGGADADAADSLGDTALMTAVMHKQKECARMLLPHSNLVAANKLGQNALHISVTVGNWDCFSMLVKRVGDLDSRTVQGIDPATGEPLHGFGRTALHLACLRGQHDMAAVLLHRGALRTARDSLGCSPAYNAAQAGHLSCLVLLLGLPGDYKMTPAEVNTATEDGWTALHAAAYYGQIKCCGALIAAGASLDAKNKYGCTPLMLAQSKHPANTALLELLSGGGSEHPPGVGCDQCGGVSADGMMMTCIGCNAARYCSAACAARHWRGHKAECERLVAAREETTRVREVARPQQ